MSQIEHFSERLASVGGVTHHVATPVAAADLIASHAPGTIWCSSEVQKQMPDLASHLGSRLQVDGTPEAVRDQQSGLAVAHRAIAETGSCLLVESTLADRAPSLMTHTLFILCSTRNLLESLDHAAPVLREISESQHSYATLVTGPSRTADIERQLTVGVQGPAEVHVIFVDESS